MLIFKSLASKNYRLFFTGQAFSNLGSMMQQVAIGWLVYRITGSALLLGIVSFSREIAVFTFSTVAGVLADRYNKHQLLMVCQSLIAGLAVILAFLTLTESINIALLITLQLLFGLVSGLEMPSRHAFVNDLVTDKLYLTNAIALNSSLFNTARIVGPALAGALIPIISEGYIFLIYAVASIIVVFIFRKIRYLPVAKEKPQRNFKEEFLDGAIYALTTRHIRFLIVFVASITLVGISYTVVLPVVASEVLMGDALVYGYMTSAIGIGSLIGAVFVGSKSQVLGLDKWILAGSFTFGVGLLVFSASSVLLLSLAALVTTGLGRVFIFTGTNTLLQTLAPEEKRGRVLSFYIMLFMGALALGSFGIGLVTDWMGAPLTLLGSSFGVLVLSAYYAKQLPMLRKRTYRAMKQSGIV
nr:MFS transporter [Cytophagales bacterium]